MIKFLYWLAVLLVVFGGALLITVLFPWPWTLLICFGWGFILGPIAFEVYDEFIS
jgi:hypothetical protein